MVRMSLVSEFVAPYDNFYSAMPGSDRKAIFDYAAYGDDWSSALAIINGRLAEYNATIANNNNDIVFETEADMLHFLLKWS